MADALQTTEPPAPDGFSEDLTGQPEPPAPAGFEDDVAAPKGFTEELPAIAEPKSPEGFSEDVDPAEAMQQPGWLERKTDVLKTSVLQPIQSHIESPYIPDLSAFPTRVKMMMAVSSGMNPAVLSLLVPREQRKQASKWLESQIAQETRTTAATELQKELPKLSELPSVDETISQPGEAANKVGKFAGKGIDVLFTQTLQNIPLLAESKVASMIPVAGHAAGVKAMADVEAKSMADGLRAIGVDDEDLIRKWSGMYGVPAGITEYMEQMVSAGLAKIPVGKKITAKAASEAAWRATFGSPIGKIVLSKLKGMGIEGTEELVQGGMQYAATVMAVREYEKKHPGVTIHIPDPQLFQQFVIGAGVGGMFSVAGLPSDIAENMRYRKTGGGPTTPERATPPALPPEIPAQAPEHATPDRIERTAAQLKELGLPDEVVDQVSEAARTSTSPDDYDAKFQNILRSHTIRQVTKEIDQASKPEDLQDALENAQRLLDSMPDDVQTSSEVTALRERVTAGFAALKQKEATDAGIQKRGPTGQAEADTAAGAIRSDGSGDAKGREAAGAPAPAGGTTAARPTNVPQAASEITRKPIAPSDVSGTIKSEVPINPIGGVNGLEMWLATVAGSGASQVGNETPTGNRQTLENSTQGSPILESGDRGRSGVRTPIRDAAEAGATTADIGARPSSERRQPGQQAGESRVNESRGTPAISRDTQDSKTDRASSGGEQNYARTEAGTLVAKIRSLLEVRDYDNAALLARTLQQLRQQRALSQVEIEEIENLLSQQERGGIRHDSQTSTAAEENAQPGRVETVDQPRDGEEGVQQGAEAPRQLLPVAGRETGPTAQPEAPAPATVPRGTIHPFQWDKSTSSEDADAYGKHIGKKDDRAELVRLKDVGTSMKAEAETLRQKAEKTTDNAERDRLLNQANEMHHIGALHTEAAQTGWMYAKTRPDEQAMVDANATKPMMTPEARRELEKSIESTIDVKNEKDISRLDRLNKLKKLHQEIRKDIADAKTTGERLGLESEAADVEKQLQDMANEAAVRPATASEPAATPTPAQAAEPAKAADVAAAAHTAATSPKNDLPEPTEAQKKAGNYTKGHTTVHGLDVTIENPAGSRRKPEFAPLKDHYGYIKRTEGADGDQIDVFINRDRPESDKVYVISQNDKNGVFDEHKIVMGASNEAEARQIYLRNYEPGWNGLGSIQEMTPDEFKAWAKSDAPKKSKPTGKKPASAPLTTKLSAESTPAKQEKQDDKSTTAPQASAATRQPYPATAEMNVKAGKNPFPADTGENVTEGVQVPKDVLDDDQIAKITGNKSAALQHRFVRGIYTAAAKFSDVVADMFYGAGTISDYLFRAGIRKPKRIMVEYNPLRAIQAKQLGGPDFERVATLTTTMATEVNGMMDAAAASVKDQENAEKALFAFADWMNAQPRHPSIPEERWTRLKQSIIERMHGTLSKKENMVDRAKWDSFARLNAATLWSDSRVYEHLLPEQDLAGIAKRAKTIANLMERLGSPTLTGNDRAFVESRIKLLSATPAMPKFSDTPATAAFGIVTQNLLGGNDALTTNATEDGGVNRLLTMVDLDSSGHVKKIDKVGKSAKAQNMVLYDADIRQADSWQLMGQLAEEHGNRLALILDPSYFSEKKIEAEKQKGTKNYDVATNVETEADLLGIVDTYVMPTWRKGARIVLTNTWTDSVARELRNRGFNVEHFNVGTAKKPRFEFIAWNFNTQTGELYTIREAGLSNRGVEASPRRGRKQLVGISNKAVGDVQQSQLHDIMSEYPIPVLPKGQKDTTGTADPVNTLRADLQYYAREGTRDQKSIAKFILQSWFKENTRGADDWYQELDGVHPEVTNGKDAGGFLADIVAPEIVRIMEGKVSRAAITAEEKRAADDYAVDVAQAVARMEPVGQSVLDNPEIKDYLAEVGASESKPYQVSPRIRAYRDADNNWHLSLDGSPWRQLSPRRRIDKQIIDELNARRKDIGSEPLPFSPKRMTPAEQATRDQIADTNDVPINPKVKPLVDALNKRGVPTVLSGDLYGQPIVYVDLPHGTYIKGRLVQGTGMYERALMDAKLPKGWSVIPADMTGSKAFIDGKPEAPYDGPRSAKTRLIRHGGAVTKAEAQAVADAVAEVVNWDPLYSPKRKLGRIKNHIGYVGYDGRMKIEKVDDRGVFHEQYFGKLRDSAERFRLVEAGRGKGPRVLWYETPSGDARMSVDNWIAKTYPGAEVLHYKIGQGPEGWEITSPTRVDPEASVARIARMTRSNVILNKEAQQSPEYRAAQAAVEPLGIRIIPVTGLEHNAAADPMDPSVMYVNTEGADFPLMHSVGHETFEIFKIRFDNGKPTAAENPYLRLTEILRGMIQDMDKARSKWTRWLGRNVDDAYIEKEMMADLMGENFQDTKFWKAVWEADASLFEKLVRIVKAIIDRILQTGRGQQWSTKQHFSDLETARKELANIYATMAKGDIETGQMELQLSPRRTKQDAAPVFFSQVERTVENAKQPKAPGAQWWNWIKSQPGVKQEELEWIGLQEWLGDQKSVTRDELLDFIRANKIEVQEVMLGESDRTEWETLKSGDGWKRQIGNRWMYVHKVDDGRYIGTSKSGFKREFKTEQDAKDWVSSGYGATESLPTKFHQYQLPGGENYRELLLTLPTGAKAIDVTVKRGTKSWTIYTNGIRTGTVGDPINGEPLTEAQALQIARQGAEQNFVGRKAGDAFRSSHFSEPNVLAHVRFNERTDAEGKRVLFIEEVQSDWHQRGREQGYASNRFTLRELSGQTFEVYPTREAAERDQKIEAADDHELTLHELAGTGVPDAPFKTTWPLLAMKRMIRYAAENGFDKIAWTTGEQQGERYDLSKQVEMIYASKRDDGTFRIRAYQKKSDAPAISKSVTQSELPNLIGKDLASKIISDLTEVGDEKEYRGPDLKVGAEGMRAFYDAILPAEVNKYVKKWGGKVGTTQIPVRATTADEAIIASGEDFDPDNFSLNDDGTVFDLRGAKEVVHSLPITDPMREAALAGQPLFSPRRSDDELESLSEAAMNQPPEGQEQHRFNQYVMNDERITKAVRDVIGKRFYEVKAQESSLDGGKALLQEAGSVVGAEAMIAAKDTKYTADERIAAALILHQQLTQAAANEQFSEAERTNAAEYVHRLSRKIDELNLEYGRAININKVFRDALDTVAGIEGAWRDSLKAVRDAIDERPSVEPVVTALVETAKEEQKAIAAQIENIADSPELKAAHEKIKMLEQELGSFVMRDIRNLRKAMSPFLKSEKVRASQEYKAQFDPVRAKRDELAAKYKAPAVASPMRAPEGQDQKVYNDMVDIIAGVIADGMVEESEIRAWFKANLPAYEDYVTIESLRDAMNVVADNMEKIKGLPAIQTNTARSRARKQAADTVQRIAPELGRLTLPGMPSGPQDLFSPGVVKSPLGEKPMPWTAHPFKLQGQQGQPAEVSPELREASQKAVSEFLTTAAAAATPASLGEKTVKEVIDTAKAPPEMARLMAPVMDMKVKDLFSLAAGSPGYTGPIVPGLKTSMGPLIDRAAGAEAAAWTSVFSGPLSTLLNAATLKKAIDENLAQMGTSLPGVVRQHYTMQNATQEQLVQAMLAANPNLKPYQAYLFAKAIRARIHTLTQKEREAIFRRILKEKAKLSTPGKRMAPIIDDFMALTNMGALERADVVDKLMAKEGVKTKPTPADYAEMKRLSAAVRDAPEGHLRDEALVAARKFITDKIGINKWELAAGMFYANIFTAYTPHINNAVGNTYNALLNNVLILFENPAAAPLVYATQVRAILPGIHEAIAALEGRPVTRTPGKIEFPKGFTAFSFKGGWRFLNIPLRPLQFALNLMTGGDMPFYKPAEYAKLVNRAYDRARTSGMGISEAYAAAWQEMWGTPEEQKAWIARADAEVSETGLRGAIDRRRRVAEQRLSRFSPEERLESARSAADITLNTENNEHSWAGHLARTIRNITQRSLASKYRSIRAFGGLWQMTFMFTRIAANITDLNLAMMGIPVVKGMAGSEAWKEASPEQKLRWKLMGAIGWSLMLSALALNWRERRDDDDPEKEKPWNKRRFWITGNGPKDAKTRSALQALGWTPYSMKVGNDWIKYQKITPLAIPLSIIGTLSDIDEFNLLKDDATVLDNAVYAAVASGNAMLNMSFLNTAYTLVEALSSSAREGGEAALRAVVQQTQKVVPYFGAIRNASRDFDPTVYESNTAKAMFWRDLGVVGLAGRPKLNIWGEPIKTERPGLLNPMRGIAYTTYKSDPTTEYLAQHRAMPPKPVEGSAKKRDNGPDMTPDEFYQWFQVRGQLLRANVEKNMDRLKRIQEKTGDDGLREEIEDLSRKAGDKAKRQLW